MASISSSPSAHQWKNDVFVSFSEKHIKKDNGNKKEEDISKKDIEKGFIDHLFRDFKRKGINAYGIDGQSERGKENSFTEISEAIEKSRFLVVIFSEDYAWSSRCLRELVKIMECREMGEPKYEIRTIFYDVKPYVVRYQAKSYKEAFEEHEASSNKEEVPKWREALRSAADLSGWDLEFKVNGFESTFIDIITKGIFEILCHGPLHIADHLVGLHSWAERMNLNRFVTPSEVPNKVHMIGICGIGGSGKTTIARAIYNFLYIHFKGYSFCENVTGDAERDGLPYLQKYLLDDLTKADDIRIGTVGQGIRLIKQRIRTIRALIILDNVDHHNQLAALAGNSNWFCPGSLIIMTSRDRQLLNAHGMEEIYEVDYLNDVEALELFSWHAFNSEQPIEEYKDLADRVVQYAKGHPLTLEVFGDFLCNKEIREWQSELSKRQRILHPEVLEALKKSYDELDRIQQAIFLDIACFFVEEDMDFVTTVVDGCDLYSVTDIRVLVDKLLITISEDRKLQMHDLIQQMGKEIVRQEPREIAERSRLWFPEEVSDVLNNKKGTNAIQGLVLDLSSSQVNIGSQTFTKLDNLRLLKLYYGCLHNSNTHSEQDYMLLEDSKVCSRSPEFLSNELRLLCWHGYPFEFLPSSFFPENLVVLDMSYSCIKQLWTGSKGFDRLTQMKLNHCCYLIRTPDFTQIPNLKELILQGCTNLDEVHESVGLLERLTVLNLENCINLRNFPGVVKSECLQVLNLSNCSKVDKLPEDIWKIETLVELHVDGTTLNPFPSSILSLNNLQALSLGRCGAIPSKSWSSSVWPLLLIRSITQKPTSLVVPSLSGLCFLKILDVSHCNLSSPTLDDIGSLSSLEELNLSGNDLAIMPSSFSQLSRLRRLGLVGCRNLQAFAELPSSIELVDAADCMSLKGLTKPSIMYTSNDLFFLFPNCAKLVQSRTFEAFFSSLLPQGYSYSCGDMSILLPGSEIPKRFSFQNKGDNVKVKLPPFWASCRLKGIAIAAAFTPKKLNNSKCREIGIRCHIRTLDCNSATAFSLRTKIFRNEIRSVESDHIWLSFWTSGAASIIARDYIDVSFDTCGVDSEIKHCGVGLLYDKDDGDCCSERFQYLSPSAEVAGVLHPVSGHESVAVE